MNYREVVVLFVSEFPEFKMDLDSHIKELDEIFPYVFFPQVFHDHVEEIIKSNSELDWIKRFFSFLELMASTEEKEVTDLLSLTFLDNMRDDPIVLKNAKAHCGVHTTKYFDNILRFYGHLPPLITEVPSTNIDNDIVRKRKKKQSKDIVLHKNQIRKKR